MAPSRELPLQEAQIKLLTNPLRIRILHALVREEQTAAQVADALCESRGNVHYHIKKLHQAGLLSLSRTEANGGILERYYRAETVHFRRADADAPASGSRPVGARTWISRTPEEITALMEALLALLGTWEAAPSREPDRARTWRVDVRLTVQDGEESASEGPSHDDGV